MTKPPTGRQREALAAIRQHRDRYKLAPTLEEVARALATTKSTARQLIETLVFKGCVERAPGRYRNLIVTRAGSRCLKLTRNGQIAAKAAEVTR